MAHAFVAGGTESESERPLSVGGVGTVDKAIFQGYHYVALGHLHRPQSVGEERIHYPGSLLKYSFSEADHKKSVSLVELSPDGGLHVERIPLTPRRDLRQVSGSLKDLLEGPSGGESRDDYLQVTLSDKGAILDAMGRLREVYPNVLHLERPFLSLDNPDRISTPDYRRLSETELFTSFFHEVTGEELTPDQEASLTRVVDEWRRKEREA
jgi:exonuclease SbcD